jgi:hypothetical protein
MNITRVIYGLAALPLLAGVAMAETPKQSNSGKAMVKHPIQLNEKQMDKVTAGWDLQELDVFNTGIVWVSIYEHRSSGTGVFTAGNSLTCASCYLVINNFSISVASQIGR